MNFFTEYLILTKQYSESFMSVISWNLWQHIMTYFQWVNEELTKLNNLIQGQHKAGKWQAQIWVQMCMTQESMRSANKASSALEEK